MSSLLPSGGEPPAVLAQGPLNQVREMERVLQSAGITAEVVRPPDAKANT